MGTNHEKIEVNKNVQKCYVFYVKGNLRK